MKEKCLDRQLSGVVDMSTGHVQLHSAESLERICERHSIPNVTRIHVSDSEKNNKQTNKQTVPPPQKKTSPMNQPDQNVNI